MKNKVFNNYNKSCLSIFIVVILIGQITSAISNLESDNIFEKNRLKGNEVVVTFDHIISPSDWEYIEKIGANPLRLVSHNQILVWDYNQNLIYEGGGIIDYDFSQKASFLGPGGYYGNIKIIFEPRMDIENVNSIIDFLEYSGIDVEHIGKGSTLSQSYFAYDINNFDIQKILDIPGILWVEGVFNTGGRNNEGGRLLSGNEIGGDSNTNLAWELGLNGEGVIIGVADSGIDRDHVCFRNSTTSSGVGNESGDSTGSPGDSHRKIMLLNDSKDDWDYDSHTQGGHGTHVIGSLACHDVYSEREGGVPISNMTAMGYNSKLIIQDIVNENGWVPPNNIDMLLYESAINGGVINSYSWGDDTTAYTSRSHDLDAWARENPWSVAFIAPGNTGGQLLEPANARSVVAVGGSSKNGDIYSWSSIGNTSEGTRGIFMLAPGINIISADSDGLANSFNDGEIMMTGTSMATPTGASYTAVIQQLIEDGWITFSNETKTNFSISEVSPSWANNSDDNITLGEGFTPSGILLKALVALSSWGLEGGSHQGNVVGVGPDHIQGWGQPNLSRLIDLDEIKNIRDNAISGENYYPGKDIWIWDSYRLEDNDWSSFISERVESSTDVGSPLDKLVDASWDGGGAMGPFITTNEAVTWEFTKENYNDDIEIVLSWNPKPYPEPVDNLRLVLEMSDGSFTYGGNLDENGWSKINYDCIGVEGGTNTESCGGGEVTSIIRIPKHELYENEIDWLKVSVEGVAITSGPEEGGVGINGNKIGFALAMRGVGYEVNFTSDENMESWFDDEWELSWNDLPDNLKGDLFKDEWVFNDDSFEDDLLIEELWPDWVLEYVGQQTNFNPLVDGVLLVNPENDMIYGISEEGVELNSPTYDMDSGFTFLMNDLLDLNNVTVNAAKISVISEDSNFGLDYANIVVGMGDSNVVVNSCCSNMVGGDFNTAHPANNISWVVGEVVENFNQEGFLFTQIRWPGEFSGNLSLEINIKDKSSGDLILLNIPISIEREIDGEINELFIEGVLEWKYDNGQNISINNYEEGTSLIWNFSENPGELEIVVDLSQPRTLGGKIKNAERGLVEYNNLAEGVFLPYCIDDGEMVEEMGGFRSKDVTKNEGMWTWSEVWLPPTLWDCQGNVIRFVGKMDMGVPAAISEWNMMSGEFLEPVVSYKLGFNFTDINHPWMNGGLGISPPNMICKLKFLNLENNIFYGNDDCNNFEGGLIEIDSRISHLEFVFEWNENVVGVLGNRNFSYLFEINSLDTSPNVPLGVSLVKNGGEINIKWVDGVVEENGWPVFIYEKEHSFSHVFILKEGEVVSLNIEYCEGDFEFYEFEGYVPGKLDLSLDGDTINWNGVTDSVSNNGVTFSVLNYNENTTFQIGKNGEDYHLLGVTGNGVEFSVSLFKLGTSSLMFECIKEGVVGEEVESGSSPIYKNIVILIWIIVSGIFGLIFFFERKKSSKNKN